MADLNDTVPVDLVEVTPDPETAQQDQCDAAEPVEDEEGN